MNSPKNVESPIEFGVKSLLSKCKTEEKLARIQVVMQSTFKKHFNYLTGTSTATSIDLKMDATISWATASCVLYTYFPLFRSAGTQVKHEKKTFVWPLCAYQ